MESQCARLSASDPKARDEALDWLRAKQIRIYNKNYAQRFPQAFGGCMHALARLLADPDPVVRDRVANLLAHFAYGPDTVGAEEVVPAALRLLELEWSARRTDPPPGVPNSYRVLRITLMVLEYLGALERAEPMLARMRADPDLARATASDETSAWLLHNVICSRRYAGPQRPLSDVTGASNP